MLAAVFRPPGAGPFPAVIVFHGTEGFRIPHVQLAEYFARNGLIGIAAGWFGGHYEITGGQTIPTTHPQGDISFPNGPDIPITPQDSLVAARNGILLIQAAKTLPGVLANSIGLFGHSRGSMEVLRVASISADLEAVVAVAGYPPIERANFIQAPVLILQGTKDELIDVQRAREFEEALRASGKSVETSYYEGAPHRIPWLMPWQDDVRQQAVAFFIKNLRP